MFPIDVFCVQTNMHFIICTLMKKRWCNSCKLYSAKFGTGRTLPIMNWYWLRWFHEWCCDEDCRLWCKTRNSDTLLFKFHIQIHEGKFIISTKLLKTSDTFVFWDFWDQNDAWSESINRYYDIDKINATHKQRFPKF